MDESGTIVEAKALARAMVEVHLFLSPLYIWRTIWEEVVPKTITFSGQEKDEYEITTDKYVFVRLMALWYILTEIYQGNYPTRPMIIRMVAHRVGHETTVQNEVLSPILPSNVEYLAPRKKGSNNNNNDFG